MRTIKILTALAFVLLMCGAAQAAYFPTSDTSAVVTGIDPVTGLATKINADSGALRVTGSVTATVSGTVTATLPETVAISAAASLPVTLAETAPTTAYIIGGSVTATVAGTVPISAAAALPVELAQTVVTDTATQTYTETFGAQAFDTITASVDLGGVYRIHYVSADTDVVVKLTGPPANAMDGVYLRAGVILPFNHAAQTFYARTYSGLADAAAALRVQGLR